MSFIIVVFILWIVIHPLSERQYSVTLIIAFHIVLFIEMINVLLFNASLFLR